MSNDNDDNGKNNSVDISGTVTGSNISINQNQDGNQAISDTEIEYKIDENTYREVSGETYKKSANVFYISLGLLALGVLADFAGILAYLGFNQPVVLLVLAPICWLIAKITEDDRWVNGLSQDNKSYYREGSWYEKLPNGNVAIYDKRAKCVYPRCEGTINIVPAPPRERPNHSLIGKCSLCGVQHTYTVDYNGIGYPQKFDWRPQPQNIR
ncbi:hypothetical protein ACFSJY_13260 [Thalassotalea euphylliae]|uniref:hypothetical protein n=1 Tax=Thalassotalea euphylliae TaxID=1655234 RepID=UPI00362740DD